jgi:signal transduction histidine kinase
MERQEPFAIEQSVLDSSGRAKWVEVNGTPMLDSEGRKAGYVVVLTDIDERKRVERMKTEFISTISHELRTPLTSIAGSLGLVAAGVAGPLPERAQHMVAIAQKNSERLSTLINDLLDLEKLVDGGLPILAELHDVMPIVEQAIRDNEGYATTYRTQFVIGSTADGAQVMVDSLRLVQVLSNLLSNAAKFSPEGADVRIDIEAAEETVRISVTDSGPGIDLAFQDRIFQKFSQADGSDARSRGGSGLGLAISKELMERMNGTIGFESEPGSGSVFHVTLTLYDAPVLAEEAEVDHE